MLVQKTSFAFFGLIAASLAIWWKPLANTLRLALESDAQTHVLLIVPLSIALIYMEKGAIRDRTQPSLPAGISLLAAAMLLTGTMKWAPGIADGLRLSLSMLALAIWWIGSVVLCFGLRLFKALAFPLCFLVFIAPIPQSVVGRIIEFLQYQSAVAARIMFHAAGVPATQEGIMLSIPTLDIEVARECSSIRSSLMLVITTMVLAHLFLRSWWRQLLLVAAAVPLSVAKNGFRIFTIAELGTRVDRGFLDGKLHHQGGIIFFGLSAIAVALLAWILRRSEPSNFPVVQAAL